MPVCRYPISGSAFVIVSPSISVITCKTPCVEGCCGPSESNILFSPIGMVSIGTPVAVIPGLESSRSVLRARPQSYPTQACPRANCSLVQNRGAVFFRAQVREADNLCGADDLPNRSASECGASQGARRT